MRRLLLEEFIKKAIDIHGNNYDYSEVEFKFKERYIKIKCNICGNVFMQFPSNHLRGQGCINHSKKAPITNKKFAEKAFLVHGDSYDYSQVEYINKKTPVIIKCNMCGNTFLQKPSVHLKGNGCKNHRKKTTEEFVAEAVSIYGTRYDYSSVVYTGCYENVTILCNDCNKFFEIKAVNHLQGGTCPNHSKQGVRKTLERFIEQAKQAHGDRYDYSETKYTHNSDKVKIICSIHGEFLQSPGHHIKGHGCEKCGIENHPGIYSLGKFEQKEELLTKNGLIYCLRISDENEEFYKVGITVNTPQSRIRNIPYLCEVLGSFDCGLKNSFDVEQNVLDIYKDHKYKPLKYFGGHTECLSINPIDKIKELVLDGKEI